METLSKDIDWATLAERVGEAVVTIYALLRWLFWPRFRTVVGTIVDEKVSPLYTTMREIQASASTQELQMTRVTNELLGMDGESGLLYELRLIRTSRHDERQWKQDIEARLGVIERHFVPPFDKP